MQQSLLRINCLLSLLLPFVTSKALLAVFGSEVTKGETYPVEWLSDTTEYLELLLVSQLPDQGGWNSVQTLFQNITGYSPGGNYSWTVNTSLTATTGYGLWLSSTPVDSPDTGYADLSDWFTIKNVDGSYVSSVTSVSTISSTPISTSAAITTTSSTSASATNSSSAASQATETPKKEDNSLQGGAIAGIVIGSVAAIALIVIAAFVILRHKRKGTSGSQQKGGQKPAELGTQTREKRHELVGEQAYPQEKSSDYTSSVDNKSKHRSMGGLQEMPS